MREKEDWKIDKLKLELQQELNIVKKTYISKLLNKLFMEKSQKFFFFES